MNNLYIPAGYQQVMPYLMLPDAGRFFDFMHTVFGATEKMRDVAEDGSLRHGELRVGECTFMYSEARGEWGAQAGGFYIHVANADETYAAALSAGSRSVMPVSDQSYGRSGGVLDPFGNTWWITTTQAPAGQ